MKYSINNSELQLSDALGFAEKFEACSPAGGPRLIEASGVDVERVEMKLLAHGAKTLLERALQGDGVERLDALLDKSSLLKSLDAELATAAMFNEAVRTGARAPLMLKAWRMGQVPDARDRHGMTALGWAIENGDEQSAAFLIERGADPEAACNGKLSARQAILRGSRASATHLLELASIPASEFRSAYEPGAELLRKELLSRLAGRDMDGARQLSAVGACLPWGSWEFGSLPTCPVADIAISTPRGLSPVDATRHALARALAFGHTEVIHFLLMETPMRRDELFAAALATKTIATEAYAWGVGGYSELHLSDGRGDTLLHAASRARAPAAIEALLCAGADPDIANRAGETARGILKAAGLGELLGLYGLGAESIPSGCAMRLEKPRVDSGPRANRALPLANLDRCMVQVFSADSLRTMEERAKVVDSDRKKSYDRVVRLMKESSGMRECLAAPSHEKISELAERFPTFAEVVEDLSARAAITSKAMARSGGPRGFKMPNILLLGKPGMGKTHFARALAEACRAPFHEVQVAAASAGFVLSGVDAGYSTGRTGKIFDALAEGLCANPFVLLDEIDKAGGDSRNPVTGPLFSLLEPGSARLYSEEFASVPIDASHINFCATANDTASIDAAILSRFVVYEIPDPTPEQSRAIALSVYRDILAREGWQRLFAPELRSDMLAKLCVMSPREAHQALSHALPRASLCGRDALEEGDFKPSRSAGRTIGFT